MVNYLSIALNLLVLALMLIVLWRVEARGGKANLKSIGTSLLLLGILVLVVGLGSAFARGLYSQWGVFKYTGMSIFTAGVILLIQVRIRKKPANLPIVRYGAIVVALIALAFVIWFLAG